VKKSGKDEPVWVVIHICMETTQGISLYSYFYLKLAKTLFFLLSLMFSLQQNQSTRGRNRFYPEREEVGRSQMVYTPVSKCKKDKIKNK
jgi:hypothetical protein